jgi:hypothetical protein
MSQVYLWDFTLSEKLNQKGDILRFCREECTRWCFQLEQPEVAGKNPDEWYKHYQCRVSLKKKLYLNPMMILMRNYGLKFNEQALSRTSKTCAENKHATFSYVMKEYSRIDGPWDDKQDRKFKSKSVIWVDEHPEPWHRQVLDTLKDYEHRKINLLIDSNGNTGKTNFEDWLAFYNHAFDLWYDDDHKHMLASAYDNAPQNCFTINLERALDKKNMRSFWTMIERMKDGRFQDNRYKCKRIKTERPHIWIFTNFTPEVWMQSKDRWNLWTINDDKELVEYTEDHTLKC